MENKESYLKYQEQFKRINLFALIAHSVSILLVLTVIFLPLFKCKYEILGIEFSKDVSIFNEICENFKAFSSNEDGAMFMGIYLLIFPALTAITGGCLVFVLGKQLYACVQNLSNVEQMCMLEYVAIKKSGDTKKEKNFFKNQNIYSFLFCALFTVVFATIDGEIFSSNFSLLANVSGLSGTVILAIIELVALIVVNYKKKKEKKEVLVAITKEEFEQKQVENKEPVQTTSSQQNSN